MKKRILSVLLVVILALSLMPITALADDSPHTHTIGTKTITFQKWEDTTCLPTETGSYYLANDVTFHSSRWEIPANKTINLCLNGHVIKLDGSIYGNNNISINLGATLNLFDCGTAEHRFTVNDNGLWTLNESAAENYETVTGGCITGGKNGIGGAIYLSWSDTDGANGATLNMYGGNIIGNQSTSNSQGGGAVFVDRPSTFNMYGGKIIGNTAKNGGAVYIYSNSGKHGTFKMSDGEIRNNKATEYGGGVYVSSDAVFNMSGGTITGCSAQKGGGVFTWGDFTMNNNSAIVGCTASIDGGGVCACNCSITMNDDSKVSKCNADNGAGGVYIWADPLDSTKTASFTMNGNSTISNCEAKATYYENRRSGGGVCVEGNKCTFTMNGGSICRNNGAAQVSDGCGGSVNVYSGAFTMNGGLITDNTATTYCAGVFVNSGATFTMTGDSVISNNNGGQGAGVYSNGTFAMKENSKITGNTGTLGGGVGIFDGTFTMSGNSKITYNTGTYGGGLYVDDASFKMTGNSTINHNTASGYGGGLFVNSSVTLGGTAKINNNVKGGAISNGVLSGGTANNVFLPNDKYITLSSDDAPTSNFKVGVTTQTAPSATNPTVQITANGMEDDVQYFFSDNKDYEVQYSNTNPGYLELIVHKKHIIETVDGQAPTEVASGYKDYYKCTYCHKCFEDADGLNEISDIDKWKAKGGDGYIAPLVHKPELVNGKKATYTEAGYKSYYVCKNCGKYYEDAKGLNEISDINKWKAKGGKGYLPKLEKDPDSPQTGDSNNMTLWIILLVLSYTGLFTFLFFEKIRNEK